MKGKQLKTKSRRAPEGMRSFFSYIPEELLEELDAALDRKTGILYPRYRYRTDVFTEAIRQFLDNYASAQISRGSGVPANQ